MSALPRVLNCHRQLSFRAAFASEAEKKSENLPESPRIPNPYTEGSMLSLSYSGEDGQLCSYVVEITKAFSPFTCSQTLLVRLVSPSSQPVFLPSLFILKLADIRFTPRGDTPEEESYNYSWTYEAREAFVEGVRRVRSQEWGNEWSKHILEGRPYLPGELEAGEDQNSDLTHWSYEMDHFAAVQAYHDNEKQAYRTLQSLQSRDIPRLFGTVSLVTGDPEPLLSSVRGLALEYIEGQTLASFKLGETISIQQAERVTQATLRAVRRMRDSLIAHNDLALRNIMVRRLGPGPDDFDFDHPVIIDFGLSDLYSLEEDDYETLLDNLRQNVTQVRHMFSYADWHKPSLYLGAYQPDSNAGFSRANRLIENLDVETRTRYFEEIPEAEREASRESRDESGTIHVYEAARWRLRTGVRGKDADMFWEPLGASAKNSVLD